MILLAWIALFGWTPVVLILFSSLPPRRAVVTSFILAWLFLPCLGYDLPGLPEFSKRTATSVNVLLATALFHSHLLFAFRPRWFDLPLAIWCVCPFASSMANGLGAYDGVSATFDHVAMWGLPYLVGRIYFTRLEHLRDLAIGIVVGGLLYVLPCIWEFRMSPSLHGNIYGFTTCFGEIVLGGYRPVVFLQTPSSWGCGCAPRRSPGSGSGRAGW